MRYTIGSAPPQYFEIGRSQSGQISCGSATDARNETLGRYFVADCRACARRVRKNNTSCQRCFPGRRLKEGIPRQGLPLVIFQNSAPSLCDWTIGCRKSAECLSAMPLPLAW